MDQPQLQLQLAHRREGLAVTLPGCQVFTTDPELIVVLRSAESSTSSGQLSEGRFSFLRKSTASPRCQGSLLPWLVSATRSVLPPPCCSPHSQSRRRSPGSAKVQKTLKDTVSTDGPKPWPRHCQERADAQQ